MNATNRRLVSTGSPFEKQAGYSRAVAVGGWCFVAGTTGYDYTSMDMPDSAAGQAENTLRTIDAALREADFGFADIVRINYIVTDAALASEVFAVTGRWLADIRPAATIIVAGLLRPEMKVEIEATAFRG